MAEGIIPYSSWHLVMAEKECAIPAPPYEIYVFLTQNSDYDF